MIQLQRAIDQYTYFLRVPYALDTMNATRLRWLARTCRQNHFALLTTHRKCQDVQWKTKDAAIYFAVSRIRQMESRVIAEYQRRGVWV